MNTEPAQAGPRERWLADGIIAGFVATGASLAALVIAFVLANGASDSQSDIFRLWLWQLTHNDVVSFSRTTPAIAIIVHVLLGLVWALIYARFGEPLLIRWAPRWAGWQRGMAFAVLPWLVSIFALLPAAAVGLLGMALSAGPLPPIGNFILHMVYGFVLGQLYDASADQPALAEDLTYDEPLAGAAVAHAESFGAAGIVAGALLGAAIGIGMAVVLPPVLPNVDFTGWSLALAVGGILAGGAVGGTIGSFAGLPTAPADPLAEQAQGPDAFERVVLPFLIPPFLVLVIASIIVTFGSGLLQLGKSHIDIGPVEIGAAVIAALIGILVVAIAATWLASRAPSTDESELQSPSSSRETVSHSGH